MTCIYMHATPADFLFSSFSRSWCKTPPFPSVGNIVGVQPSREEAQRYAGFYVATTGAFHSDCFFSTNTSNQFLGS